MASITRRDFVRLAGAGSGALLAACSSDDSSTPAEPEVATDDTLGGKLMLYTSSTDQVINAVVPAFEQATGVAVTLTRGTPAELFSLLDAERNKPVADAIWGGSPLWYAGAQDLLHPYVSPNNSAVATQWRNSSGLYTPITLDCPALAVATPLGPGRGTKLRGYQSLLDAALAGRVAMPDPATSDIGYQHLYSMLEDLGGPEADEAWQYVAALVPQLVGKAPVADASAACELLLSGEADVALVDELTQHELNKLYELDDAETTSIYPQEGVTLVPSCAAVVAACDNLEQAQAWVDFLVSEEGQAALAEGAWVRTVRSESGSHANLPVEGDGVLVSSSDDDLAAYVDDRGAILATFAQVLAGTWTPAEPVTEPTEETEGDKDADAADGTAEASSTNGESVETSPSN